MVSIKKLIQSFFFAEYLTFADIRVDEKGLKSLTCNGHTFGEYYINLETQDAFWACTEIIFDPILMKKRSCRACLKTKIVQGYEMIRTTRVRHDH